MYLRGALQAIERTKLMSLEAVSSVYETDPVGFTDQPAFLNIAARVIPVSHLRMFCRFARKLKTIINVTAQSIGDREPLISI
jgi:2-amino-4-hydroxy-6-hydroxymethyldihydropteridine diphosphokinase